MLAGFLWIAAAPRQWFSGLGATNDFQQIDALSFAFVGWSDAVLAYIGLTYPNRGPARHSERAVVILLAAAFSFQTLIRIASRGGVLVGANVPDEIFLLVAYADLLCIVSLATAGVLIVRRWMLAPPLSRHILGPVLVAGAATAFAPLYRIWYPLSALNFIPQQTEEFTIPGFWITNAIRAVPIAMLVGILRQQQSRSAVADAIANVGSTPTSVGLQRSLAKALGDPSLRVLTWNEAAAAYVDDQGEPAQLPGPDDEFVATPVAGESGPLAVLVHDRALEQDPALVAAGVAVTRLVSDNERLSRNLQHQLLEVRASRARIVEAGDAERQRIERDLHDGVQQRILAMALALKRAEVDAHDQRAGEALTKGADEALGVVNDVRELARGIHPAVLSEAGLSAALRALADRSPIPVELDLDVDGIVEPTMTATVYFAASEALANVFKHSDATSVRLSAVKDGETIRVVVEDDGRGGADPGGVGLRGLDDRVAAVGGKLTVRDRPAGGTIVTASLPNVPA